jgi:beta-lactamase class D
MSLAAILFLLPIVTPAAPSLPQPDFKKHFAGYDGCFVMQEVGGEASFRYNDKRCREQLSPCSTFKIFNAMAGLDCGALAGPETEFKWDKTPQYMKSWERDHTLASAITNSVVWYFKIVAQKVGSERMKKYLDANDYGNKDMSAGLTEFWLGSSLKISADEQVRFLDKLYTDKLSFKPEVMATVRKLIILRSSNDWVFSGKTGSWATNGHKELGWFVGHVKRGDRQFVFAVNIRGEGVWGMKAREIVEKILAEMKLID